MKSVLAIFAMLFTVSAFANAQNKDGIIDALKQGNAAKFSSYLDEFVDIKLPQKDEIKNVSKTQAAITVKSFFDENSISGFDLTSQRELGGTMYITGKLHGNGRDYNLTIMLKNKDSDAAVITVRIN